MKYRALAAAVFAVVCWGTPGVGQPAEGGGPPPEPPPTPPSDHEGRPDRGPSRFLEGLPEETRERFLAAREKALEDPRLQELRKNAKRANREFFKAMRDKMLEIDPGLAEIVRKQAAERKARKLWRDPGGLGSLSNEEREKLISVMEQVDDDPAVAAAKRKKWDADSADERRAAVEDYRKAVRDAMKKVDPTIAPILDKLSRGETPPPTPAAGSPTGKEQE